MAVTDSEPFVFFIMYFRILFYFLKKREMLYRDFVLLQLCYVYMDALAQ